VFRMAVSSISSDYKRWELAIYGKIALVKYPFSKIQLKAIMLKAIGAM